MTISIETSESEALPWAPRGAVATARPALETDAAPVADKFKGDNAHLVRCIQALLNLDARGALVPHGIGSHARDLLSAAAYRLPLVATPAAPSAGVTREFAILVNREACRMFPESRDERIAFGEGARWSAALAQQDALVANVRAEAGQFEAFLDHWVEGTPDPHREILREKARANIDREAGEDLKEAWEAWLAGAAQNAAAHAAALQAVTDEAILALNAGERFFSESPSKYPEAGFGTQYHAGKPGVLQFARAVLVLAAPIQATTSPSKGAML
ncbi:hypothetical protein [Variovorax sp. EBFNA2]|uniref:hypothetical protein n=1 Tax=Variovorax sp. EBFNA2 TaxID=3342097 RepID=UPI0029C08461|nr:hypothetical protein [Variovorax boronicumulans]WPG35353.1 hypothetical protein RZE79_17860 [Variovorax boronicumulans]